MIDLRDMIVKLENVILTHTQSNLNGNQTESITPLSNHTFHDYVNNSVLQKHTIG